MGRAMVYRAHAIPFYNFRKPQIAHPFQSFPKTTFYVIRLCQLICLFPLKIHRAVVRYKKVPALVGKGGDESRFMCIVY